MAGGIEPSYEETRQNTFWVSFGLCKPVREPDDRTQNVRFGMPAIHRNAARAEHGRKW
jgi:hypothetical protein